jgi:hypothetical protein
MKKQAIIVMDRSRKSLDREQAALRQVQEALELKEFAVADALRATQCEDYMLDLMIETSQDMAGVLHWSFLSFDIIHAFSHILFFLDESRFLSGCCH